MKSRSSSDDVESFVARARRISSSIAAVHAHDVDRKSRFPAETIEALRSARLLSVGIPCSLGGSGGDIASQFLICHEIAISCASSAMILAMHYIQVDCLVNHPGEGNRINEYLSKLAAEQRLLASVTSEVGVDGDLRRSLAAIEPTEEGFKLEKQATTISYGQYADDFLVTARSGIDAAESEQCLVLAMREQTNLTTVGEWDTLGMRGTCSPGGQISTSGAMWQILEDPFHEIAPITMVPVSHLLWSSCWLGIADSALTISRRLLQRRARKDIEAALSGARRLSALSSKTQRMRTDVDSSLKLYVELISTSNYKTLSSIGTVVRFNDLKITASEAVADIAFEALKVCGISAYRNDTESSLGRQIRDALSASLMINNDRIRESNAQLHLVLKGA